MQLKHFPDTAILSWFVHNDIATAAIMEGRIIEEEDVEVRPEKVPTVCIDENVCLETCRKHCTTDAWLVIRMLLQLLGTTPCGIVIGVPGLSQMTHSHPLCVSAAWDGFILSVLASSNHPRQRCGSAGSVVLQSRGRTSIVFSTLD